MCVCVCERETERERERKRGRVDKTDDKRARKMVLVNQVLFEIY